MTDRGGMRRSSSFSGRPSFGFALHGPQRVPNAPPSGGGSKVVSALKRHSTQQNQCPSSVARQRLSSAGMSSTPSCVKDTRPFTEKVYKEQMTRKLVEFLTSHGYAYPINLKNGPSKADFRKVFEFMVGHLQQNFKINDKDKLEDVVTRTLKSYAYPFTISKSHLSTIGVPHTWPPLLAALSYLRTCIETLERIEINCIVFDDNSSPDSQEPVAIYPYIESTYANFLSEHDAECERLTQELLSKIDTSLVQSVDITSVEEEVEQLSEQLKHLESEPNKLTKLEKELRMADSDIEKLEKYVSSLMTCHREVETLLENLMQEQQLQATEREKLAVEIQARNEVVSSQRNLGVDVQLLNSKQTELKAKLSHTEKELMEIDKELLTENALYCQEKVLVESDVEAFNKKAQLMQLVPRTAINANDCDFEMRPVLTEAESNRYENTIKPSLYLLNQRWAKRGRGLEDNLQKVKEDLEHLCETIAERREECSKITNIISAMDAKLERVKENHAVEMQSLQSRIDEMNAVIASRRSQGAYETARRQLQAETDRLEQEKARLQTTENKFCEYLIKLSQLVVDYKIKMKENLPLKIAEAEARARQR